MMLRPTRMESQGEGPRGRAYIGRAGTSARQWGFEPRISLARRGPAAKASSVGAPCCRERHHDVSILIGLGGGVRGVEPGSKVSMMIMRPPQHGHGNKCIGGSWAVSVSR